MYIVTDQNLNIGSYVATALITRQSLLFTNGWCDIQAAKYLKEKYNNYSYIPIA